MGAENQNQNGSQNQDQNQNQNVNENSGAQNQTQNQNQNQQNERTFTQEEVSRMMTKEKQQGKQSVLNALGFKSEDEAKNAFNLLKALTDSQKSEQEKAEESKNTAVQQKADAEKRAELAEAKLSCFANGVNKDAIDDVLVIAMSKVSSEKSLDTVLEEMKKESRYAPFFASSNGGGNTGTTPRNNDTGNNGNAPVDYGKQIAERFSAKASGGSKFF